MNLSDLIAETATTEERMRRPADFFAERSAHYLVVARNIARSVMLAMRPPEMESARWEKRVDEIATAITTRLLTSGNGLLLSLDEPKAGGVNPVVGDRSGIEAITFEDVLQWIQDGLDGKPGGKIITEADEKAFQSEAAMNARASIIMKAYYGHEPNISWQSMRQHIQRWMRGEGVSEPDKYFDAIATAWQENFTAILGDDLARWVGGLW
jgi:hypothetical protein